MVYALRAASSLVNMVKTVADYFTKGTKRVASSSATQNADKKPKIEYGPPPVRQTAPLEVNKKRVRLLTNTSAVKRDGTAVAYWMSRDQRSEDNWALLNAQELAITLGLPLYVVFNLVPRFLDATERQFGFMLKGLREVEQTLNAHGIPFHLLRGHPQDTIPVFAQQHHLAALVTDFSPLRVPLQWVKDVASKLDAASIPVWQVDAHNIVPCWIASDKLEYGARTIRPKIHKHLPEFLTDYPPLQVHPHTSSHKKEAINWDEAFAGLEIDRTVKEVDWAIPGMTAGKTVLQQFCEKRLMLFATSRNDPTKEALSNLSPWFHFGQLSVQRAILTVKAWGKHSESIAAFVEESVVRRELADNFCFYQPKYDSLDCAYEWARTTLEVHSKDKREHVYTLEQFETAKTHDDLWNAAQLQMVKEGKMHGFLRMYWAKKILEWTASPAEALRIAIYLNDRYNLDGRDPNGYVGCAWSIAGVHDQGWGERAVFGKIRYMNYAGCKRKFDVDAFVRRCDVIS